MSAVAETGHAGLARADALIWTAIAAAAAAIAAATLWGDFRLDRPSFAAPAALVAILMAAARFYLRRRGEPKIAAALATTAQLMAFAAVGAPLSYIAASLGRPLHDGAFAAADAMLGLDWSAALAWMQARPLLHMVLALSYASFALQATATVLALAFAGRLEHLRVFMLAFILAALASIAISAVVPAEGVWGFYRFSPGDYPDIVPATRAAQPVFDGLRDGSFRMLAAVGAQGIITFPSFHAALGVIFIASLWFVPVLRWIGLALNALMILSTPVDGGHYVVDVIAGVAIAVACLVAARQIALPRHSRRRHAAIAAEATPRAR